MVDGKGLFRVSAAIPALDEQAYLRLALLSRYPDKPKSKIEELAANCATLDDAITAAIELDFGLPVAMQIMTEVLWRLPACSRCRKYRALSTADDLCYGCRTYPGFAACTKCHLYWDDSPQLCQRCGEKLWKIRAGDGAPMISITARPHEQVRDWRTSATAGSNGTEDGFDKLVALVDDLEARCERVWNASAAEQKAYRQLRRTNPKAARKFSRQSALEGNSDEHLVPDLDHLFDGLCAAYLGGNDEKRAEIRSLMEGNRRHTPLYGACGWLDRCSRKGKF